VKRVFVALLAVYVATLAPDVTFWDAGEFITAGWTLGIPHPPGTPLYVLLLRGWALLLSPLAPPAAAMNLLSAAATAAACALGAFMLLRQGVDRTAAAAAGFVAGTMATVWLNATETEVYSVSLLLGVLAIWSALRYSAGGERRWLLLSAYMLALAVPVHISALLAGPAVIHAVWRRSGDAGSAADASIAAGVWLIAVGAGRVSAPVVMAGAGLVAAGGSIRRKSPAAGAPVAAMAILIAIVALSAVAYLYVRAAHDPLLNQGDPSTLGALGDVVARRQYAVAPLWPRQAPLWLQGANLLQYADWQVALSLGPEGRPSIGRTFAAAVFVLFGIVGSASHHRANRDGWRTLLLLLLGGSVGAAIYLNLKAGPSFGLGGITDGLPREARDRDYFFIFGFWVWGLWAGMGCVGAARWLRLPPLAGFAAASLPLLLNFNAVSRSEAPHDRLPLLFATELLASTPRNGVLLVAGDNDTYPVWYLQGVRHFRRDVIVVTLPLLGAAWYREELARRHDLIGSRAEWRGSVAAARDVAARAARQGRPLAAAVTIRARDRRQIDPSLEVPRGLVFVSGDSAPVGVSAAAAERISAFVGGTAPSPRLDPLPEYIAGLLECPAYALQRVAGSSSASLDSRCNLR
jgi:hypothetical protein